MKKLKVVYVIIAIVMAITLFPTKSFAANSGAFTIIDLGNGNCRITDYDSPGVVTSLNIPATLPVNGTVYTVTEIGNDAFDTKGLSGVSIPESVTSIGDEAFYNNDLVSVNLPSELMYIGKAAFSCNQLFSVSIPKSVIKVDNYAFADQRDDSNNKTMNTLIFETSSRLKYIGEYAFYENNLSSINLPNTVTYIGKSAFFKNNITSFILPFNTGYVSTVNVWSTVYNGNNLFYNAGAEAISPLLEYVFIGTGKQYTVTLDNQGEVGSSILATYDASMPQIIAPTKSGSRFGGYFNQAYGGGKCYYNADAVNVSDWDIASNTTLYALWLETIHSVEFNSQNGSSVSDQTLSDGSYASKPTDPTRSGYTFGGWYTDSDCTDGNWWNFAASPIIGDTILYAKWIANSTTANYTVEFDSQSGSNVSDQTISDGNYASKPTNPTRSDYTFGGWYTDSDYTDGNWWNFNACQVTTDTTLYAKWESITEPKTDVTTVSLSYGSKSMFVDDVFALTAIVLPDDATDPDVVWDSSDYTVAMVNSAGVVTATGIGTATISATADGVTDSCKVTVNPDPDVDVSEVKLTLASDFSAIMYVGDTTLLEAFVSPSDATVQSVTWSSSDASIATVSASGKVTAVSVGDVKITAEAQGKTDTYNISVKAKDAADATATPAPTDAPTPEPTQKAEATPTPEEVVVVVEIDVTKLPEGTKYIKLPNGDVVEINGEDTLTIEVLEDELDVNGGVEIIALDDKQVTLGSVACDDVQMKDAVKQVADSVPAWKYVLIGIIGLVGGAGITIFVLKILVNKKNG